MAQGSAAGSAGGAKSADGRAAEQRREQLLRAALDVIVTRGYADTRIADVAEHAGTSPALVIYYFKTRDQLLTEALRYSEDHWYETGTQRLEAIETAAGRLAELIAMTCLPDTDPGATAGKPTEWLLWLDLWALSPRNPGVAAVRRKFDERRARVRGHAVGAARWDGRTNRTRRSGCAARAGLCSRHALRVRPAWFHLAAVGIADTEMTAWPQALSSSG